MVETKPAPRLSEAISAGGSYSFEFFPPRTDAGERQLWAALRELEGLHPTFVSVTYGAGGSTRDRTVRITQQIAEHTTFTPVAHLTCVAASADDLRSVIASYAAVGVTNVLAIRGDPPGGPGTPWQTHAGGLDHADGLVGLVKSLGDFTVGVAAFPEGHPEAATLEEDVATLRRKQDAGADFAVTQFFFDHAAYLRLRDRAEAVGVTIPIVPGIMPVTNVRQIKRFAQLSGAQLPSDMVRQLEDVAHDPDAVRAVGISLATTLCERLLDAGAPGLHFYTLNRSSATREIHANLGLADRS